MSRRNIERREEMNNLKIFNFENRKIRTLTINDTIWWVAKDIAGALEYKRTADAIRVHVEEEDKGVGEIQTPGGIQTVVTINESGLYSLILSSKLPSAKKFKRWVTSEVLPDIRKHGMYMSAETLLGDPDVLIKTLTEYKKEKEQRIRLEQENRAMKPKAFFAESVMASKSNILIGELAKILKQNGHDIGQNRLFDWMRKNGYLISRKGTDYNMPTQRSMDLGLFKIKESTVTHSDGHTTINKTTKVTGKGQVYFVNKFNDQEVRECY